MILKVLRTSSDIWTIERKLVFTFVALLALSFNLSAARIKKDVAESKLKPLEALMIERVVILKTINKEVDVYNSESDPLFKRDYMSRQAGFVVQNNNRHRLIKNSIRIFDGNVEDVKRFGRHYYGTKLASVQHLDGELNSKNRNIFGIKMFSNGAKVFQVETAVDLDNMFLGAFKEFRGLEKEKINELASLLDNFVTSDKTYNAANKFIRHEFVKLANNFAQTHIACHGESGEKCGITNIPLKVDDEFSRFKIESRFVRFHLDLDGYISQKEINNSTWHLEETLEKLVGSGKAIKIKSPAGLEEMPLCIETVQKVKYKGAICFNRFNFTNNIPVEYGYFYPREYDLLIKNKPLFERLVQNEKAIYHQMSEYIKYKIKESDQKEIQISDDTDVTDGI